MPAKLLPLENYLSFSSVLHRQHMPEFNNSPAVLEISNHHNFVDFLYVFENRPSNVDTDRENRLELMHDIFDDDTNPNEQTSKLTKSKVDKRSLTSADAQSNEALALKSNRSPDQDDLMNLNLNAEDDQRLFSPAFLNGNDYKPICGLHQTKLYSGSRFVGYQKTKNHCYGVEVVIQYVDFENLYLCGHFKINGSFELALRFQ